VGSSFIGVMVIAGRNLALQEHHGCSMHSMLTRFFCLAIVSYVMAACTLLQTTETVSETTPPLNQRAEIATIALLQLQEIDTLVKLDNGWLADQIKAGLREQAVTSEKFKFRKLKLNFNQQLITLETVVDINDDEGNVISASVTGEILFDFSGARLGWLPSFDQLQINSKDFNFNNGSYAEPIPELTQYVIQSLRSSIAEAVVNEEKNTIPINAVPLGEIQVGASLPTFTESPARHTQPLRGGFMVTGSAILIEAPTTTVALDMTFIPDLSTCPVDVSVSRAEFASDIESREPVGIASDIESAADINYFYSEIAGAKRPLTIIHYWFADGLPQAVAELAVGPSERWRTWSGKGTEHKNARHWEVLVVDKESGCILTSRSIHTTEPDSVVTDTDKSRAAGTFSALKEEFNNRTAGFTILEEKPDIALIEVRRPFLSDVLQASLADLSIDAEFDTNTLSALQFSARVQPFNAGDIVCERRSCTAAPACTANLALCKRLRDTRDCSSCLFRNPLNNRCVSEAVDPLCEAARNRQNAKYDRERAACISNAESEKQKCDQLNAQAVRSCQIEAGFEGSVCITTKDSIQAMNKDAPLAHVSAESNAKGTLSANFSNFRIDGDLEGLKLDMTLKSDLQLDGELSFSPAAIVRPLANCIAAWSGSFNSRFVATPKVNILLTPFVESSSMLTANWSGFGVSVETNPSPVESMFVANPQLLANCRIGLTVSKVEQAFAQDDANFFRGLIDVEIQPLPTRIHLAPATIEFGDKIYSAEARLGTRSLRFNIQE
jgi:hypothetical protein